MGGLIYVYEEMQCQIKQETNISNFERALPHVQDYTT